MADEYSNEEKSQYNEANLQILRLHNSWVRCGRYSTKGDFNSWNWELDRVWRDLAVDAKKIWLEKDKPNIYYTTIAKFKKDIAKAKSENDKDKLYELLNDKEIFLKELQDKSGKGSKYVDVMEGRFE